MAGGFFVQFRSWFGQPFLSTPPGSRAAFFNAARSGANLLDDLKSRALQLPADEGDVLEVLGLHVDAQGASDDVAARVRVLVVDADDVRPASCDDLGDGDELPGFIQKLDVEGAHPARHQKASLDDAAQDGDVDVAARNEAAHFLARKVGELARHHGGKRCRARTLRDHLLLLDERQNGGGDLVVRHGDDVVHIFLAQLKGEMAGLLDRDAVCNGGDGGERLDGAVVQRVCHRGRARRLYAVNFHARIDVLDGKRDARDEPAPADGHHDGIHVGKLL